MKPIPLILITGYLGAGKTSLLNHLLTMPWIRAQNPALIINEFGAFGVDGALVASEGCPVFELNKGSLFCICIKTDFLKTLRTIADDVQPGLVIVEATGVAEPADLEQIITEPELSERFHVSANLCLVDAAHFLKVLPMLKAAREQVLHADALIINKTDLVPAQELETLQQVLRELNPYAPIVRVNHGCVGESLLRTIQHRPLTERPAAAPPPDIYALSIRYTRPVERERFLSVVQQFRRHILRMKGHVQFQDGRRFIEIAGEELLERNVEASTSGSAVVVIAWQIPKDTMLQAFMAVQAPVASRLPGLAMK